MRPRQRESQIQTGQWTTELLKRTTRRQTTQVEWRVADVIDEGAHHGSGIRVVARQEHRPPHESREPRKVGQTIRHECASGRGTPIVRRDLHVEERTQHNRTEQNIQITDDPVNRFYEIAVDGTTRDFWSTS